ncbi:MAG: hypothetical protein HXX13_10880 [Bacteroidetes bacterium]|nr:hypothetical protein [Bacteroidota bacterium]
MKKAFILICLSLYILIAQSQNVGFSVKSGEITNFRMSDYGSDIRQLGTIGNYAYFLFLPFETGNALEINLAGKNPFIYKCDLNNAIVKKTEVELKNGKKELQLEGILILKDKIFVFSSFQNSKDKKHYLFVQNFNPTTLELVDNSKLADELDYSGFSKFNGTLFHIQASPDSSKVLIFYSLMNKKSEELRSGINVYDSDINLLWKNDNVTSEFTKGIFGFSRFKVDNKGVVYLLGQHYEDKSNYYDFAKFKSRGFFSNDTYFTDMPNYTFEMYRYAQNQAGSDHYSLTLSKKFIRSMNFLLQDNGSVFCAGLYSEPGKISVTGSFSFNLDINSKSIVNLSTIDLGNDLITRDLGPDEMRRFRRSIDNKQEWDPYDYALSEIKTRRNGEKYFIAEQHIEGLRTTTSSTGSGVVTTVTPIYVTNDLFVVNMNMDNTIKRNDKITKRQFWLDENKFNSYAVLEKNNTLYFLYNTFEQKDAFFKKIEIGDSFITRLDVNGKQAKGIIKKKGEDKMPIPVLNNALAVPGNSIMYGLLTPKGRAKYQFQQVIITE